MTEWLVRQAGSEPIGPVSTALVLRGLQAGKLRADAEVRRVGTQEWMRITEVPDFSWGNFEDAETSVTDSPWFLHEPERTGQVAPVPAPRPQGIGLPPPRPPLQSQTRVQPPPTRPIVPAPSPASMTRPSHGLEATASMTGQSPGLAPLSPASMTRRSPRLVAPSPASMTRQSPGLAAPSPVRHQSPGLAAPSPMTRQSPVSSSASTPRQSPELVAGLRGYDEVDDDAETRVASPMERPPVDFSVDDETMTRVAAPAAGAPVQRPPGGVLPTLPMEALAEQMSRAAASPRPAAGAPPPASFHRAMVEPMPPTENYLPDVEVHPAMRVPQGNFPPVAAPPAAPPPAMPSYSDQLPQGYPHYGPQGLPPPYAQVPPPSGDQGLKALVALIVFLAVALAIVVILLIVRR